MLDRAIQQALRPAFSRAGAALVRLGVGADAVTLAGFVTGMAAALAIGLQPVVAGLVLLLLSRLLDGLEGAVARASTPTDRGGFLDITLDFLFYAAIPLGFAFADPARNALAAATLLAAFAGTMYSFLAFAVLAAKRQMHSLSEV